MFFVAQSACAKSRTLNAVPTRIGGDESAAHDAVPHGPARTTRRHGPAPFVASGRSSKLF
ncbi:hypothetical protein A5685_12330 [Mycobacterium colombiense]|uniref:Uncharacterized protein n=1 Tax=Mycobacterium colombiense TaxID=339268 RepID=A0A1A2RQZ6_9MYCO|nr:hypothetical protein A5685_12330 [Mycobacterium colombiense]